MFDQTWHSKRSDRSSQGAMSYCSSYHGSAQMSNLYFQMKLKRQYYHGEPAIAIYIENTTHKIISKLQRVSYREKLQIQKQSESYNSTINHELRAPLQSTIIILASILNLVRSKKNSKEAKKVNSAPDISL